MARLKQKTKIDTNKTDDVKLANVVETTFAAFEQLSDFFTRLRKN